MGTMDEFNRLRDKLKSKIRVVVEWDGRQGDDPVKTYEAYTAIKDVFSVASVQSAVKASISAATYDFPDEMKTFAQIEKQLELLETLIKEESEKIQKRAKFEGKSVDKISDAYLDRIARRFEERNVKHCVLVAPDLWLPGI